MRPSFVGRPVLVAGLAGRVLVATSFVVRGAHRLVDDSHPLTRSARPPPRRAALLARSAISNQNNKARLQLLEKREELLEQVFDDARAKISDVTKDEANYTELLKKLVLQVRLLVLPSCPLTLLRRR